MQRLVAVTLLFTVSAVAAPRRRAVTPPSLYPLCSMITGTAAVTFTRDEGRTLVPTASALTGVAYTYGLTALDTPRTLMALHRDELLISPDAGCSWRVAATITGWDFPPALAAARGERVYAWSDARAFLVRWDSRGAATLKAPVDIVGLQADRIEADRVRAGGVDGSIHESRDAGQTWELLGRVPAISTYRIAFDPVNLDHIVAGTLATGAHFSFDGGRTWTRATGLPASSNAFNVVVSPADGNVVWAMANDLASSSKHIFLSRDGGRTYERVIDASADVTLVNGPVMAAHPTNPNILYFVFGTFFQGYGTDLFRYDASTRKLTKTHSDHDDINAIAFARDDANVMYLGLENM